MKVLVTLPLTDAQADRVRDAAGDAAVVLAADRGEQRREIQDADVLFGHMTPELLEFAPHVQWVQQTGAGVDSSLFPAFVESDILLTSEKGYVGNHLAGPRHGPAAIAGARHRLGYPRADVGQPHAHSPPCPGS